MVWRTGGKGAGTDFANGFVQSLLTGRWHGIPAEFFWMVGIAIVLWVLLNRHRSAPTSTSSATTSRAPG